MLRHDHVTNNEEIVPAAHALEGEFEDLASLRRAQQLSSTVAGEVDEMQVTGLLKTLQSPGHGQNFISIADELSMTKTTPPPSAKSARKGGPPGLREKRAEGWATRRFAPEPLLLLGGHNIGPTDLLIAGASERHQLHDGAFSRIGENAVVIHLADLIPQRADFHLALVVYGPCLHHHTGHYFLVCDADRLQQHLARALLTHVHFAPIMADQCTFIVVTAIVIRAG